MRTVAFQGQEPETFDTAEAFEIDEGALILKDIRGQVVAVFAPGCWAALLP